MFQKIRNFLIDARQELRHVTWPTRKEAIRLTTTVIVLSLAIAIFLGFFDYLFSYLLKVFVLKI